MHLALLVIIAIKTLVAVVDGQISVLKMYIGGHGTLQNLINNFVHAILYFYYMMAAMGPEYQKYLWWKKHLTTIQLIQFILVFVHSAQLLSNDCGYPQFMGVVLMVHSTIFFALFANFYYQTFLANKQRKTAAQKAVKAE